MRGVPTHAPVEAVLMSKEEFEPTKITDVPLKLSELSGTSISHAVGTPVVGGCGPTLKNAGVEQVYTSSDAPSQTDQTGYASELSSEAVSVNQQAQDASPTVKVTEPEPTEATGMDPFAVEKPSSELTAREVRPAMTKADVTLEYMRQMEAMMKLMMEQMKIMHAETVALRARVFSQ